MFFIRNNIYYRNSIKHFFITILITKVNFYLLNHYCMVKYYHHIYNFFFIIKLFKVLFIIKLPILIDVLFLI